MPQSTASHRHLGALHHSKLSPFSLRPSKAFIAAVKPFRRRSRAKSTAPCQALLRMLLPAAPPPPPPPVPTATAELFAASTIYTLAVGLLVRLVMGRAYIHCWCWDQCTNPIPTQVVLLPRWRRTQQLMRSPLVVAPLAIVYGFLLWQSWSPDTFSLVLPGSWKEGLNSEPGQTEWQHRAAPLLAMPPAALLAASSPCRVRLAFPLSRPSPKKMAGTRSFFPRCPASARSSAGRPLPPRSGCTCWRSTCSLRASPTWRVSSSVWQVGNQLSTAVEACTGRGFCCILA